MRNFGYRLLNSISITSLVSLLVGSGGAVVGIFMPFGWDISPDLAKFMTYIGFGLILLGLLVGAIRFVANPVEKKYRQFYIINTLDRMDKYLQRLCIKKSSEKIDFVKFSNTSGKIINLIKLREPRPVIDMVGARNELAKAQKKVNEYFKEDKKIRDRIPTINSISRLLDHDGFGLGQTRKQDRSYNKLKQVVESYFNEYASFVDVELKELIETHIDFSEASANADLFMVRVRELVRAVETLGLEDIRPPELQANIEGLGDDMLKIKRSIRVEIAQCIKSKLGVKDGKP